MEITVRTAEQLRLTEEEFELIKQKLGRVPNFNELCAFSAMWSEHCSYKNSIKWLKTLPREGGKMLVKAGEENAGLMDIGDGFGVVFKIESHNHPSAIERVEGLRRPPANLIVDRGRPAVCLRQDFLVEREQRRAEEQRKNHDGRGDAIQADAARLHHRQFAGS